jgi:hypothetical protein
VRVNFRLHHPSFERVVQGILDLEGGPVPGIGWVLNPLGTQGPVVVHEITGVYGTLGRATVTLELSYPGTVRPLGSDAWEVMEQMRERLDALTALSDLSLGEYCECPHCWKR